METGTGQIPGGRSKEPTEICQEAYGETRPNKTRANLRDRVRGVYGGGKYSRRVVMSSRRKTGARGFRSFLNRVISALFINLRIVAVFLCFICKVFFFFFVLLYLQSYNVKTRSILIQQHKAYTSLDGRLLFPLRGIYKYTRLFHACT